MRASAAVVPTAGGVHGSMATAGGLALRFFSLISRPSTRFSISNSWKARTKDSTNLPRSAASAAVRSPSASAWAIAAMAGGASAARASGGRSKPAGRSVRRGQMRATHSRTAAMSPSLARSIMVRTIASVSPSSRCSAQRVRLFPAPRGRPAGLPLSPFWNCMGYLLGWGGGRDLSDQGRGPAPAEPPSGRISCKQQGIYMPHAPAPTRDPAGNAVRHRRLPKQKGRPEAARGSFDLRARSRDVSHASKRPARWAPGAIPTVDFLLRREIKARKSHVRSLGSPRPGRVTRAGTGWTGATDSAYRLMRDAPQGGPPMVALDRRRFLRSSAAAALSLTAAPDLIMQTAAAAAGDWDAGPVRLLLPTVSDNRILIKIAFDAPLSEAPTLRVGGTSVRGRMGDTRGSHWHFYATNLPAGRPQRLELAGARGAALCQPWELATFPGADERPEKFRLLIYTCAGGHEGHKFLSTPARNRLLRPPPSFPPGAA